MLPSKRGIPPIEEVCEKNGAKLAFRLRAEYVPGPAPFPDSPEEAEWLSRRESLLLTVLHGPSGWLTLCSWMKGGEETAARSEPEARDLDAWRAEIERLGAWTLPSFAPLRIGEGYVELEHEAYEYHDSDPDSLDLDAWQAPRRFRIERGRDSAPPEPTRAFLAAYARLLPEPVRASSALAPAFK